MTELEQRTMRPQPSRLTFHEICHAIAACHFGRYVGNVAISPAATPIVWHTDPAEDVDAAEAIRQDLVISVIGRLGEAFHRPEVDERLTRVFSLPTHEQELRDHKPSEIEFEVLNDEINAEWLPSDDERQAELLDRLEMLEPDIDRRFEYQQAEGNAAELLVRYSQLIYLLAERLRDEVVLPPGAVNAVFDARHRIFNATPED